MYWVSATILLLRDSNPSGNLRKGNPWTRPGLGASVGAEIFFGYATFMTLFTACSVAAVMVACTMLRTHLFIWTVFSPKYLYCVAWSVGQHLLVNVVLGGMFFWLGGL